MIKESAGKISDELYALGNAALPAYLLTGKTPVLFDAGMTFMGPTYLQDLKKYLGDARRLSYNLLITFLPILISTTAGQHLF